MMGRFAIVERLRPVRIVFLRHDRTVRDGPAGNHARRSSLVAGMLTLVTLDDHRSGFLDALLARDSARARRGSSMRWWTGPRSRTSIWVCSARRCRRSATGGRWARSTSPRSTTRPRSPSRSSTGSAGSCGGCRRTGGWRSSAGPRRSCTRSARAWWPTSWRPTVGGAAARRRVRRRTTSLALVESEQPDLVALSTATAGVIEGVVEVLRALKRAHPRPCIVAGGQFWTAETTPTAIEFGADLVIQDPRELVAGLRERIPPPEADVTIREGRPADAAAVLALFDDGGRVARRARADRSVGQRAVLGHPRRASPPRPMGGRRWAADRRATATAVGAHRARHAPGVGRPRSEPERYIEALVTSRAHAGQDIGGALVRRAIEETRTAGARSPARGLLGGRAAACRLVRAPGLRPQRHLRGPRLARPGLLARSLTRRGGAATAARCGTPGTSGRRPW